MLNATLLRAGTFALVLSLALSGCGSPKRDANNAANALHDAAADMGRTTHADRGGAEAGSAGMNCGAVKPVWVNTKSGTYHEPGDPYYGHTKRGKYMCPSAARSGYRPTRSGGLKHSEATQE
jgi:hypothetical protein